MNVKQKYERAMEHLLICIPPFIIFHIIYK